MKRPDPQYLPTDIPGISAIIVNGSPQGVVTDMEALLNYQKWNPGPVTARILKPQPEPISTLLFGMQEAAAYAGVSVRTIRKWARAQGLEFTRAGKQLIALEEGIDEFIRAQANQSHGHDGHDDRRSQNKPQHKE